LSWFQNLVILLVELVLDMVKKSAGSCFIRARGLQQTKSENGGGILAYSNALSAYRSTRVTTAGQGQLIIMLYDEVIKNLDQGLHLMQLNNIGKKGDPAKIEQISKAILKAQELITELIVSLDFDQGGDIAKSLFSLYTWFNQELLGGNIDKNPDRITAVREMVGDLRSAWFEVITKGASEIAERPMNGLNIAG
jgi:flagellar protein FliS